MSTIRNVVAALAVVAAVVLPATGAAAAGSSPAVQSDDLATAPTTQARVSIVDLVNSFTFCDDEKSAVMYPPSPYFVLDCMRGAPASNG